MNIVLYSTGCPKCMVLKRKLTEKGVVYVENNSIDEMLSMGFAEAPVLVVDDEVMNFPAAVGWVNKQ